MSKDGKSYSYFTDPITSTMVSVYETCATEHGNDMPLLIQCVSNWVETRTKDNALANDPGFVAADFVHVSDVSNWLLILTGALIFFMQAGFAMVCAGAIRKKNVKNTMLKNLLDACGAGIAFYMIGYGIAYGSMNDVAEGSTFVGNSNFFLWNDNNPALFFFQYAFSATCVTIIAGTLAERCQMSAYIAYSLYLSGFVYPVVVHNIWSSQGFFSVSNPNALIGIGMVDFAGSGVVHITGGSTALYATMILGARQGRFHDRHGGKLTKPGLTKGHSVALQMLGTFILFFGWFGFNPGSALLLNIDDKGSVAALAAVTTTLSAAAGTVSCLFTNGIIEQIRTGEFTFDIVMAMNGCISGLVAITAGCAVVEPWAALPIGVVAGWAYILTDKLLIHNELDDAVAAIQVHLSNGIWGVIAVGLLASPQRMLDAYGNDSHPGFFYAPTSTNLLPAQLAGALFIIGWTLVTTLPFFVMLDYFGLFRVNALEEIIGLDAMYQNFSEGPDDGEEPSEDNEEVRLAAYRQRFAERKKTKEAAPQTTTTTAITNITNDAKSVEDAMHDSWGGIQPDPDDSVATTKTSVHHTTGSSDSFSRGTSVTTSVAESASQVVENVRQLTYKQWKQLQAATMTGGRNDDSVSEQAPSRLSLSEDVV